MRTLANKTEQGQATTEFVVAMLAIVPILFGVIFIGKLADIKHQAIQGSRFAAFEHALNQPRQQEGAGVVANEVRARFFTDHSPNKGKIGFRDDVTNQDASKVINPLWMAADGKPLIKSFKNSDINVSLGAPERMKLGFGVDEVTGLYYGDSLNRRGLVRAGVQVSIADLANTPFSNLAIRNLKITADTVIAGDAWNGGGSKDVAQRQTVMSVPGKTLDNPLVHLTLGLLASVFSDATDGPQFGCVMPDVVPKDVASNGNLGTYSKCPY